MRSDILVTGASGDPLLAVEVKARRGVSGDWAAQLRRNLNAHGSTMRPRFFVIVTSDESYLWRESEHDPVSVVRPDAVAATADLLGSDVTGVEGRALELRTSSWLHGLTLSGASAVHPKAHPFVIDTGLADALKGAAVDFQVA